MGNQGEIIEKFINKNCQISSKFGQQRCDSQIKTKANVVGLKETFPMHARRRYFFCHLMHDFF